MRNPPSNGYLRVFSGYLKYVASPEYSQQFTASIKASGPKLNQKKSESSTSSSNKT